MAVTALGLAVQALLPPRLTPGDFLLTYPPQQGSGSVLVVSAGMLAIASVLLAVTLKSRPIRIRRLG